MIYNIIYFEIEQIFGQDISQGYFKNFLKKEK